MYILHTAITCNSCHSIMKSFLGVRGDKVEKDGTNELTRRSRCAMHLCRTRKLGVHGKWVQWKNLVSDRGINEISFIPIF